MICAPPACRAIRASPITSGSVPYSLDSRTRSDRPAMLVCTIWRSVWFSKTVAGIGAVAAPVTAVLQVPVQAAGRSAATAEPVRVRVAAPSVATTAVHRRRSLAVDTVIVDTSCPAHPISAPDRCQGIDGCQCTSPAA